MADTEIENQYAQSLYAQQSERQQRDELEEIVTEGKSYRSPSKLKYGILFVLAIIADAMDFVELTGVGWFVAKLVSIVCTAIILLIFFFTGTKQKKAKEYQKRAEDIIRNPVKNIAHAERMLIRAEKISSIVGIGSFAGIIEKFSASAAANLIPVLDLVPWMLVGVYLSYRDEKNILRGARESAEIVEEAASDLNGAVASKDD